MKPRCVQSDKCYIWTQTKIDVEVTFRRLMEPGEMEDDNHLKRW